jgi:hypothetical protein
MSVLTWLKSLETKDVATLVIALYGAVLSSFNFIVSLNKERRRLRVEFEETTYYSRTEFIDDAEEAVVLRIANIGNRSVVIRDVTLTQIGALERISNQQTSYSLIR